MLDSKIVNSITEFRTLGNLVKCELFAKKLEYFLVTALCFFLKRSYILYFLEKFKR